jgi:hypothetical protein
LPRVVVLGFSGVGTAPGSRTKHAKTPKPELPPVLPDKEVSEFVDEVEKGSLLAAGRSLVRKLSSNIMRRVRSQPKLSPAEVRKERQRESNERLLMLEEEQFEQHRLATIRRNEARIAEREVADMAAEEAYERKRLLTLKRNQAAMKIYNWMFGRRQIQKAKALLALKRRRLHAAVVIQTQYRRYRQVVAAKMELARLRRLRKLNVSIIRAVSMCMNTVGGKRADS